jgi:signal recognition particle subunit SEC65
MSSEPSVTVEGFLRKDAAALPPLTEAYATQGDRDLAVQMVVEAGSQLRLKGQNVILFFWCQVGDQFCFMPIGTFPDKAGAEAARDVMWKKYNYDTQFNFAIGPVGQWCALPDPGKTSAVPLVVQHLRDLSIQNAKPGRAYASPDCAEILDRINKEAPKASPEQLAQAMERATIQPAEDSKSFAPPSQAEEKPAPVVDAAGVPVPTKEEKLQAIIKKLKSKRGAVKKNKKKASVQAAPYKPGQKEAFDALTDDQRKKLCHDLVLAQQRNDQERLQAIYERFGPIAVMDKPVDKAPAGLGTNA